MNEWTKRQKDLRQPRSPRFYVEHEIGIPSANSASLANTNSVNPLKSGKIVDDMEITRLQELLRSWQLSFQYENFTLGDSAFM